MAPIVHGLEAEYAGRVVFSYLDIDDPDNERFKEQLGYRVQPHLFLLDSDGRIVRQWLGFVGEEELRQAFESALGEN